LQLLLRLIAQLVPALNNVTVFMHPMHGFNQCTEQEISTTISTHNNSTTMPGINDALEQVCKLKLGKKLVYTTIAKNHVIDCSSLSQAH
jgi:hypothetical protein